MLRRIAWLSLLSCGAVLVSLRAGEKDFWVLKPYTEWSAKEVDKMLKNSPWTKSVNLPSAFPSRRGTGFGDEGGAESLGGQFPRDPDDPAGGGGGAPRGGGLGDIASRVAPPVYVSWYSRPIREALARRLELANPEASSEQVANILGYNSTTHYALIIMGMRAGMSGPPSAQMLEKIKEETYLRKKNKVRIPLDDIVFPSGPGQPLALRFLKEIYGKPTLTLEDKEVDLVTRIGQMNIQARFKLADMVVGGKLEL